MKYLVSFILIILSLNLFAQKDYLNDEPSIKILYEKFKLADSLGLKEKPINEIFITIAKSFIGTEYEGFVLEKPENESVFCYLTGLDCVSIVDNSLAIARCIKAGKNTLEDFLAELEFIRYRDGKNKGYTSRLHYFSDYLATNEKKGILTIISDELGADKPLTKKINWMTKNKKLYRQINANDEVYNEIKKIEEELNKRNLNYISKEYIIGGKRVARMNLHDKIQDGDLIALVSADESLDLTHSTIAVKIDGRVHILHASKPGTKVYITKEPLEDYLAGLKNVKGIVVARLK